MKEFCQTDYNSAVKYLAETIVEQFLNEEYDTDYYDLSHETIHASQYVIYTYYHHGILWFASNPNYAIEEGVLEITSDTQASELIQTMAYFALWNDVDEAARSMLEDHKTELNKTLEELESELEKADEDSEHYEFLESQIEKYQEKIDKIDEI